MTKFKACPHPDCRAADPRQTAAAAELASVDVAAEWVVHAQRCTYCGSVYSREADGSRRVRGWLEGNG